MRTLHPLGLVLLFGALGAAAAPTLQEVTADLERVEKSYWDHAKLMDANLAELHEIKLAFPSSPAQEKLLQRRRALREEFKAFTLEENSIRSNLRDRLKVLHLYQVSRLLNLSHGKTGNAAPLAGTLAVHEGTSSEIRSKRDRLLDDFQKEERDFISLAGDYETRKTSRRFYLVSGAVTAGAFTLIALVLLSMRRKRFVRVPAALPGPAGVGNYELRGLIGQGAMGEVYDAVDKTLGRRAALKRLRGELLTDPADLERLLAEARVVASLKHPNIVAIYSVEREGDQVFLAFEFVDGDTLERILEQNGRLDRHEALRICLSAASALQYAHAHRIVHRDLKPANIMLTRSGTVKIMDFGIAHEARKSVSRLTRAAAWGTPPYMAPEQELGGVSAAVDLFALSVSYYEMLTGQLPFKGPNYLAQKREALYAPPSTLAADLSPRADAFFKTALAPEPSRRFPTAEALAAAAEAAA